MNINDALTPAGIELREELTKKVRAYAEVVHSKAIPPVRVHHAIECGKALAQLKELFVKGGWNEWLAKECALNRMTANRYIRLASRADQVTRYMTMREAYIATGVIAPKLPGFKPPAAG
jgi:hypothetical protein